MKFTKFVASLFLIYESSFNLVKGQINNNEKSDCTKLLNFLNGDVLDHSSVCCSKAGIRCDNNGYITSFSSEVEQLSKNNYLDTLQNFSKLENLHLPNYDIKEIPDIIFKITTLKNLDLSGNKIEKIPPSIGNLIQLEELNLANNNLKELPSEIYKLNNLKTLDLNNNSNLNANITKFGNSSIDNCKFNNINVKCYEPDTCKSIEYNNKVIPDAKAISEFQICNSGIDVKNKNETQSKSSFVVIGLIILVGTVAVLTGVLITVKIVKRNKAKKLAVIRSHLLTIRETETSITNNCIFLERTIM